MPRRWTIEDMQEVARDKGGLCLSKRFVNVDTKLRWQCAKKHRWSAIPYSVQKMGTWCPECAGRLPKAKMLALMRKTAKERGGRCLAKSFGRTTNSYEWQCKKGHRWHRTWDVLKKGGWCPQCAGRLPPAEILEELKQIAKEHGGRVVSRRYVDSKTGVEVRCKKRHQWRVSASDLRRGKWCGICAGNTPHTIESLRAIAVERGGKLLSKTCEPGVKARWRCGKGHSWSAMGTAVKNGTWCPTCARAPRYTLQDMQAAAARMGGECLSKRFRSVSHHLRWRCAEGHEWKATGSQVANGGTWCTACAGLARGTIKEMREIARERGGRCTSKRYVNSVTPLAWKCGHGHQWEAAPVGIKRGAWCPFCQRRGIKGIENFLYADLVRMAEERGGACLSDHYVDALTPMTFQCQVGHVWEASAGSLALGSWCPDCAHTKKPPLALFQDLAREREGRCLSETYVNGSTPLEFECRLGHRWRTRGAIVRNGSWCPTCARAEPKEREVFDLSDFVAIAADQGGECLSTSYGGLRHKLEFRCRRAHTWHMTAASIRKGAWCPTCLGRTPLTIEDMQSSARNRGGVCLSGAYAGNRKPLEWQCGKGHIWEATPQVVRGGSWCPTCMEPTPDAGIARVSTMARGLGGLCLSGQYHDPNKRLRWRCGEGHEWWATEATILTEGWCPLCE